MVPVYTYEIVKERQNEIRREAQRARVPAAGSRSEPGAGRLTLRRGIAHTLRRVADTVEPTA